jgi:3-dehydroquinate synthase
MAEELGLIDQRYCTEILALIGKTGMEFSLDSILGEKLVDHMMKDKKNRDSRISFILPRGRGETAEVLLTRQEAWGLLRKFMG